MSVHYLPEGTTEPQRFVLQADDAAINLTGLIVGIEVYDATGAAVASPGAVSVVDADAGLVQLLPVAASWPRATSPYNVRWTVTNGALVFKVPNGQRADVWHVAR